MNQLPEYVRAFLSLSARKPLFISVPLYSQFLSLSLSLHMLGQKEKGQAGERKVNTEKCDSWTTAVAVEFCITILAVGQPVACGTWGIPDRR